ncbi:MAG: crotonase/enoyl-CoA hydratase family protein [Actinomycetota bacterium]
MSNMVTYEVRGNVALITLNRPDARNAVNDELAADMEACIDRLEADDSAWVGVLTANTEGQKSPVFCAGADLKALNAGGQSLGTKRGGFAGYVYRDRVKPIIAAVDGLATAGGCEIVLASDMVIASSRSSFGLAEVKRNLIAGAGGLFRLPRAIGRAVAMEVILTGEPLSVDRAYALGLVNQVVEPGQVIAAAMALAEKIVLSAPMAVAASRRVILASAYATDDELIEMTNKEFAPILRSEDTKEGLMAFIEKRAPQWKGR